MRFAVALTGAFLLFAPSGVEACRLPPSAEDRAADLERERTLVAQLSQSVDSIVIATVTQNPSIPLHLIFEETEVLKGEIPAAYSIKLDRFRVTVSCRPSDSFFSVFIVPGETHLLYLKDNEIQRASVNQSERPGLSFAEEVGIIRGKGATPNNAMEHPRAGGT